MIVILSKADDLSTEKVMRWLASRTATPVLRVNHESTAGRKVGLQLEPDGFTLRIDSQTIASSDIDAVWYRKGTFWLDELDVGDIGPATGIHQRLDEMKRAEVRRAREYVHHILVSHTRVLGYHQAGQLNKLVVLDQAAKEGLNVPPFLASNEATAIQEFAETGSGVITKAMADGLHYWDYAGARKAYFSYTERVSATQLQGLVDGGEIHFVQHEVSKAFEVRTMYLDGRMWSCAIHSQGDEKTKVDYRKYNHGRATRNVPYVLPEVVAVPLDNLFKRLKLNTGSVDFMVDQEGRHYFLEINPCGQYDAISERCNFHIDRHIADWLSEKKH